MFDPDVFDRCFNLPGERGFHPDQEEYLISTVENDKHSSRSYLNTATILARSRAVSKHRSR